jgi:hypothetical protein
MPHAENDVWGPRSKTVMSVSGCSLRTSDAALIPAASPPITMSILSSFSHVVQENTGQHSQKGISNRPNFNVMRIEKRGYQSNTQKIGDEVLAASFQNLSICDS